MKKKTLLAMVTGIMVVAIAATVTTTYASSESRVFAKNVSNERQSAVENLDISKRVATAQAQVEATVEEAIAEGIADTNNTETVAQSSGTSATAQATATATTNSTATAQTATIGTNGTATATAENSSGISKEFVEYLNAKRAAEGLAPIEWNESLATEAQKRAQEIVTNYNHTDFGGGTYLENIYSCFTGDISEWFDAWYESQGHRLMMMNKNLTSGACAFVEIDGQYYVVFDAEETIPVASAAEWQVQKEQGLADGTLQIIDEHTEGDTSFTVYAEGDVSVSDDPEGDAAADELLRSLGLL